MWNSLIDTGHEGVQILRAWMARGLWSLLDQDGNNPERHVIRTWLKGLYQSCDHADAPEAHRAAGTIEAWRPTMRRRTETGHSHPRSEGENALGLRIRATGIPVAYNIPVAVCGGWVPF